MMTEGVRNWCLATFLYVICTPCYVGSDKREIESAAGTQDKLKV
jgi:hypothetical protein